MASARLREREINKCQIWVRVVFHNLKSTNFDKYFPWLKMHPSYGCPPHPPSPQRLFSGTLPPLLSPFWMLEGAGGFHCNSSLFTNLQSDTVTFESCWDRWLPRLKLKSECNHLYFTFPESSRLLHCLRFTSGLPNYSLLNISIIAKENSLYRLFQHRT